MNNLPNTDGRPVPRELNYSIDLGLIVKLKILIM